MNDNQQPPRPSSSGLPEEGWLPDPQNPEIDRWWDGRVWTGATRPRVYMAPGVSGRAVTGQGRGKIIGLVALGAAVIVAAVVGTVVATGGGDQGDGASPAPSVAAVPAVTSSSDDWFSAVCKSGTFEDRPPYRNLPSSSDFARCRSNMEPRPMVFIGTYSSEYKMKQDLLSMGSYATMTSDSGSIVVFALPPKATSNHLNPLEKYGFSIEK